MTSESQKRIFSIGHKKLQINRFIGEGDMGGVWEINDELGYTRALKLFYKLDSRDNEKFLQKLNILRKIKHPHLVPIEKYGLLSENNAEPLMDEGKLPEQHAYADQQESCKDDEQLLLFGIAWLHRILFQ